MDEEVTAPWRDEEDDDPENDALVGRFRDGGPIHPVRDVPQQQYAEDDRDVAPLRIDVSIAVMLGACVGAFAAYVAMTWRSLSLPITAAEIAFVMLIIRWTRKR
jgi:hypothetical protein